MIRYSRILKNTIMIAVMLLLIFPVMIFCEENAFADTDKTYIYDQAGIFTDSEIESLSKRCETASNQVEIDFVIATTDDTGYKNYITYADDFMDKHDLGYEDDGRWDKSCVMLMIDFDNDYIYVDTTGFAILCIEDRDVEEILDAVYEYDHEGEFYEEGIAFINTAYNIIVDNKAAYADKYLEQWKNFDGEYDDFESKYVNVTHNFFYKFKRPYVSLGVALMVALVATLIMGASNKAKMTADRRTYLNRGNVKMHLVTDQYLRTTTTRHRINTGSGGSGGHHGGSHHSSHGGHSHGGGGRHR